MSIHIVIPCGGSLLFQKRSGYVLSEERHRLIVERLRTKSTVTVQELVDLFNSSPATIRRDLNYLHKCGLVQKVHGGAASISTDFNTTEPDMSAKALLFTKEKHAIAELAANYITDDDFVYIDAGSTTEVLLHHLKSKITTFVTNGIAHATFLAARQYNVILLGGHVKSNTGAVVGDTALEQLEKYNFTKGFFGTNGISIGSGFTTPEPAEAAVKQKALSHCRHAYVLADPSKFEKVTPITFSSVSGASIITTHLVNRVYRKYTVVEEVDP